MSWEVDAATLADAMRQKHARPRPAIDAILNILQTNLPGVLAELNERDSEVLPERTWPKAYHYAGENLGDISKDKWPRIVVGGSSQAQEFGMGFSNENMVLITAAFVPAVTRIDIQEAMDLATAARDLLTSPPFSANFLDPDDASLKYWVQLVPAGFSLVPSTWTTYSGYIAHLQMLQAPGDSPWPAST